MTEDGPLGSAGGPPGTVAGPSGPVAGPAGSAAGPGPGAGDDGRPDARLVAALAAHDGSPAAVGEVLAALAGARVFLAVTAQALGTERSVTTGLRQESTAQLSLLSIRAPSGARALPAFADGLDVARWQAAARPRPVPGPLACRTAVEDGADVLLLDPRGAAVPIGGAALRELAAGRVPVPGSSLSTRRARPVPAAGPGPDVDPHLLPALARALAPEGDAVGATLLRAADGPLLVVHLRGAPDPARLAALAERVRDRLGPDLPAEGLDLTGVQGPATPAEVAALGAGPGEPVPLDAVRRPSLLARLRRR